MRNGSFPVLRPVNAVFDSRPCVFKNSRPGKGHWEEGGISVNVFAW